MYFGPRAVSDGTLNALDFIATLDSMGFKNTKSTKNLDRKIKKLSEKLYGNGNICKSSKYRDTIISICVSISRKQHNNYFVI